jgi:RNA polymerase sigma factor (sigma-70 family)
MNHPNLTKKKKKLPFDFIQTHYREPKTDDPIKRWLPHPDVARGICFVLFAKGYDKQDLEDGLQDVYLKALQVFRRIKPPADLAGMRAFCRKLARDMAIDRLRRADRRKRDFVGLCEDPDEFTPLEYGAEQRDPVDGRRQLAVLAELFRDDCMPEHGVEILEGVACGCTHPQIGEDLGITADTVEGRMRMMRDRFRSRMAKLGMLPGVLPLHVIVSQPAAIATLRKAA